MDNDVEFEDYKAIIDSGLFNEEWYVEQYPEVLSSEFDPVFHYLIIGASKGFNPNPDFDTNYYLERNRDVKSAGMNPFVHYVKYGKNENRQFSPSTSLLFNKTQVDLILKHINNKISIIVPIYNAYEETKECIESVLKNTEGNYELILINDCSPDKRLSELLESFSYIDNIKIIENEVNKGFTGTVNVGLLNSSNNDVILLNSDTKVTKKWLTKLIIAAYSDDKIGTVTPVSNNSGAFSVPKRGDSNEIPENLGIDGMANLVEKVSEHIYMKVPTANGFCMYIKRDVINDVGLFDEINFEKGYGEENDYSMRASYKGWEHIIDDSTYIYHKSGASFSEKRNRLLNEHSILLDLKHPDYFNRVREFINSEELKFIEDNVQKGLDDCFNSDLNKKRVLYVMHHLGGGTLRTLEDLSKNISDDLDVYYLTSTSESLILYHYINNKFEEIERWEFLGKSFVKNLFLSNFRDVYFSIFIKYGIDILHIHHLINHTWDIVYISKLLNIPVILSVHDFYLICPCYTLLNENVEFCGGKCSDSNQNCTILLPGFVKIDNTKNFVKKWRNYVNNLFELIDSFITTNDIIKDLFVDIYPMLKNKSFKVIEHGEDLSVPEGEYNSVPKSDSPIKILFLGNINVHKGLNMIKKLKDQDNDSKLEFHFLGSIRGGLEKFGTYHGSYDISELPKYLEEIKPSFIGIFSIWPETFCYTLSEAWNFNIPVLSFDIGVVGDRMKKNNGGWLLDMGDMAKSYDKIINIANNPQEYHEIQNNLSNIKQKNTEEMSNEYLGIYTRLIDSTLTKLINQEYLDYYGCLLKSSELPILKKDFILEPKFNLKSTFNLDSDDDIIKELNTDDKTIVEGVKKILELDLFDFIWYLSEYGDVKNAKLNPLVHYIQSGANENRNPSEKFDTEFYLESNPDVKNANMNPLIHYALYGIRENRRCIQNIFLKKRLQINFSEFLSQSVTHPLLRVPFTDIDKKCFEFMDIIEKKLIDNVFDVDDNPVVSIIMPAFNRENIIMSAIDSVLNQTYENWELIIVDDGSSDNTVSTVKNINNDKIKLIESQFNNGVSHARNLGLEVATGKYIAYLDTDNTWEPNYLKAMVGAFLELDGADAIYSGQYIYGKDLNTPIAIRFAAYNKSMLENCNYIDINCFMHKKEVYDKLGGFDESLERWVDWDFIIKISSYHSIYSIPVLLSNYHQYTADNRITNSVDLSPVADKIISNMSGYDVFEFSEFKSNNIVIIVQNFNSISELEKCINNLAELNFIEIKIITVVDDNIEDNIKHYLQNLNLHNLIYYDLGDNYSISDKFDVALKNVVDEDILILDVKCLLDDNSLKSMSYFADRLYSCGVVIPRQMIPKNNELIADFMEYSNLDYDCDISLSEFNSKIINVPIFHNGSFLELSSTCSPCMYINNEVIKKGIINLGDFNEYEEWRMVLSNFIHDVLNLKVYYVPDSKVYYDINNIN